MAIASGTTIQSASRITEGATSSRAGIERCDRARAGGGEWVGVAIEDVIVRERVKDEGMGR
jgi:hypothetical protein